MQIGGRDVKVTNREKIFFAEIGVTKGELVDYYVELAPQVLNHVERRPMLMKRYPNGAAKDFFYQKRIPEPHPDWMKSVNIQFPSGRTADYPVITDAAALAWIANLGCIDLNTWPTRIENPELPDYLLIDLDPGPDDPWEHVREIALAVHDVMNELKMPSFPKTSDATGLHILAPIRPELGFKAVRSFAKSLAQEVESRVPEIATTTWKVADRDGVFVDFGQNARDRSIASAYSIRPAPDARASAPLAWDEVASVDPAAFTISTMRARVAQAGDLTKGMWRRKVSLVSRFGQLDLETPRSRARPNRRARARMDAGRLAPALTPRTRLACKQRIHRGSSGPGRCVTCSNVH